MSCLPFEEKMRREGHDASCNLRDDLPGFQGCNCNKRQHDIELDKERQRLTATGRSLQRATLRVTKLTDAASRIVHLPDDATLADAQEIAYAAIRECEAIP